MLSSTNGRNHAFLWDSANLMQDLGDLSGGTQYSTAYGINGSGQVVGSSATATGRVGAFLYRAGAQELENLGSSSREAYSINAAACSLANCSRSSGPTPAMLHR